MNKTNLIFLALLFIMVACNSETETETDFDNFADFDISHIDFDDICYIDNEQEGTVAYKCCVDPESGVEKNKLANIQLPKGEAYLFKDGFPEEMREEITGRVVIIMYESKPGDVTIHSRHYDKDHSSIPVYGSICNFPDFVKDWDIPKNGCKVYFKGITYDPTPFYGTTGHIPICYVLTTFKKL